MDEFFEVYEMAKDALGLSRVTKFTLDEAIMKIFSNGKLIIRVEELPEDREKLYLAAALRLIDYLQQQGESK